jgi:hypothetical protein
MEHPEEANEQQTEEPSIPAGSYVLQYGPKTIKKIVTNGITKSFKLFWDGSVCMFQDNVLSSVNNKDVLNKLLETRTNTNDDPDPPVTLLHGQETEKILRATLMRIKIEQQEALEAKKRAIEEHLAQEEEDEDENEDDAMDLADESEEKISTF